MSILFYLRSGYTGLQLLTQIIIADITTLKWRGLVSGLISLPFIINAFVGSNIATNVLNGAGWRWGCTSSSSSAEYVHLTVNHRRDVCYPCPCFSCPSDYYTSMGRTEGEESRCYNRQWRQVCAISAILPQAIDCGR